MSIESITKEKFMAYLLSRKSLDKEYGKTVVQKYEVKKTQMDAYSEKAKERFKERYASDDEYRDKVKARAREAYQRKKSSTKRASNPNTASEITEPEPNFECDEIEMKLEQKANSMRKAGSFPVNKNRFQATPSPVLQDDCSALGENPNPVVIPSVHQKIRNLF